MEDLIVDEALAGAELQAVRHDALGGQTDERAALATRLLLGAPQQQ